MRQAILIHLVCLGESDESGVWNSSVFSTLSTHLKERMQDMLDKQELHPLPKPYARIRARVGHSSVRPTAILDGIGKWQAYKLSGRLMDVPFDQVFASSAKQATQTTEVILSASTFSRGIPIQIDHRWEEVRDTENTHCTGHKLPSELRGLELEERGFAPTASWLHDVLTGSPDSIETPTSSAPLASALTSPPPHSGEKTILVMTHPAPLRSFLRSLCVVRPLAGDYGLTVDVDPFEMIDLPEASLSVLRLWWDVDNDLSGWKARGRMEIIGDDSHLHEVYN